eukprot:TRINITY_DN10460_c0_g1_i2.p1 TRINITY_DN10460_c0_g1~~TRINITY_DN10460_c0_g1_i2.p1  ORF type:complete len:151 (+),score=11.40 TRINITY_DN10460_c0_g1_i2:241-693(+)
MSVFEVGQRVFLASDGPDCSGKIFEVCENTAGIQVAGLRELSESLITKGCPDETHEPVDNLRHMHDAQDWTAPPSNVTTTNCVGSTETLQRTNSELFQDWLAQNCKSCPKCRTPVDAIAVACGKFRCPPPCRATWCWHCEKLISDCRCAH